MPSSPRYDRSRSDRPRPRSRSRSPSPRRSSKPVKREPKELNFYKKKSSHRDQLDEPESARERFERRERGEVPGRFGGTREQGVRNTMGNVAAPAPPARSEQRSEQRSEAPPIRPPAQAIREAPTVRSGRMIEVIANDRMGRKVRIKCLPSDTVGDLKKLIAAQTGTNASKIILKKWYTVYKDHVTLRDYEINDGMSLEMY